MRDRFEDGRGGRSIREKDSADVERTAGIRILVRVFVKGKAQDAKKIL